MSRKQCINIDQAPALSGSWSDIGGLRRGRNSAAAAADGSVYDIGRILLCAQQPGTRSTADGASTFWTSSGRMARERRRQPQGQMVRRYRLRHKYSDRAGNAIVSVDAGSRRSRPDIADVAMATT